MTTLTEGKHAGGFLVWEVLRDYTRETVTLASGAGKIEPGTVLGKITTGEPQFDDSLGQGDWFDVAKYPEAVFEVKGGIYKLSARDYEDNLAGGAVCPSSSPVTFAAEVDRVYVQARWLCVLLLCSLL